MLPLPRLPRRAATLSLTACAVLTLVAGLTPATAAAPTVRAAVTPGAVGPVITLSSNHQFDGYDVATDASGRAYVAWIADSTPGTATRTVFLCTLLPGASSCLGGIRSTPSLGPSSAAGIRVLVPSDGHVRLVWFHDTSPGSVNGPRGARIATSTAVAGGTLTAAVDATDAPSFGSLQDAAIGSDGTVWLLAGSGSNLGLEVHRGLTAPATKLSVPYAVGYGQIAVAGTSAVVSITKAGSIGDPPATSYFNGSWHGFVNVPHTWAKGTNVGLVSTHSGFRLITSTDDASYHPVIAAFGGSSFGTPAPTGDTNACSPSSHDAVTDASGRVVDVSAECDQVAVTSLADTRHGATLRFSAGGTLAQGNPQVASTPRGLAWVAWSLQLPSTPLGGVLRVRAVRLPASAVTVKKKAAFGKLRMSAPVSCLPAVDFHVTAKAKGKHGWRAKKAKLTLNGTRFSGTVAGSRLTPGGLYTLKAKAKFKSSSGKKKLTTSWSFRSCVAR